MTINELKKILIKENVFMSSFAFPPDEHVLAESGCGIEVIDNGFCYFEEERYEKFNKKFFKNERDVCLYLLKRASKYDYPRLRKYIEDKK